MIRLVLLRVLESYFRHRWLNLLPFLLMLGVAGAYFTTLKPVYISRGVVYVQSESLLSTINAVNNEGIPYWLTPAEATVTELQDLMLTDIFVRIIVSQTDLEKEMSKGATAVSETLDLVRESVWTEPLGNNQVLISAHSEDPQIAQQLVNAAVEGQVQWKTNSKLNESIAAQEFFSEQIEIYNADLEAVRQKLRDYLNIHPEPIRGTRPDVEQLEINRLQESVNSSAIRYEGALNKEENARLVMSQIESDSRQTYFLVDAPQLPLKPATSLKDILVKVIIIVIVGGVLTTITVVGGALLDRSFRFPIDVRHGLDLPVLTSVPFIAMPEQAKEPVSQAKRKLVRKTKKKRLARATA